VEEGGCNVEMSWPCNMNAREVIERAGWAGCGYRRRADSLLASGVSEWKRDVNVLAGLPAGGMNKALSFRCGC